MKLTDWQMPARSRRVTVRLDDDDAGHMEAIRRNVLGSSRTRLALSYADTMRLALRVAAGGAGVK